MEIPERPKELDTPEAIARREALALLTKHRTKMQVRMEWGEALYDSSWRGDSIELARQMKEPEIPESDLLKAISVLQTTPETKVPRGWIILFNDPEEVLRDLAKISDRASVREAASKVLSEWSAKATRTLADFASNMVLSPVFSSLCEFESDTILDAIKKAPKNDRVRAILAEIVGIEKVERLMPQVYWEAKMALEENQK